METFAALAKTLHVDDRVGFSGLLGHDAVLAHMRDAAVVVVPSHHDYAEGFPMTIYETLCSRTPLVASDHPVAIERAESEMVPPETRTPLRRAFAGYCRMKTAIGACRRPR